MSILINMETTNHKDRPLEITKRAVLYATKLCNVNCSFCYYREEDGRSHTSLDDIKKTLKQFNREYSIEYVDITGGEPTIHPQIIEIIKLSLKNNIKPTIITNAQKPEIISKLIDNGLEDVLVSIQGLDEKHDKAVNKQGAFDKIMETISVLNDKKFGFRTNTVLTNYSCSEIEGLAKLLVELSPRIVNLISFNPYEGSLWQNKTNNEFQLSYSLQAKATKKAIDILDNAGIWVNVRYIPLCFMKGYEKHVCNFLQLPYDPYEWEYTASNKTTKEQILDIKKKVNSSNIFGNNEKEKFYQFAMRHIIKDNKTVSVCNECSNNKICDHIYSQYLNEFGDNEYAPFKGQLLEDPMHYRKTDRRWSLLKNNN